MDVGTKILLRNSTDSDAICSFATRPFTSSRLSVFAGVGWGVSVCVCQVHEAKQHTVGQTGHYMIIPDIDLASAVVVGKTCTPAVYTWICILHTNTHIF